MESRSPSRRSTLRHRDCRRSSAASPASGRADDTWALSPSQTADWSLPANWSTARVPNSSDTAYVENGGAVTVTQTGEICNLLMLGIFRWEPSNCSRGGLPPSAMRTLAASRIPTLRASDHSRRPAGPTALANSPCRRRVQQHRHLQSHGRIARPPAIQGPGALVRRAERTRPRFLRSTIAAAISLQAAS